MSNCENCKVFHDGNYGSGRFCSSKCARSFSTKLNRTAINQKVSQTFSSKPSNRIKKNCENCDALFEVEYRKRHQKTCSHSCASQARWKNLEYRENVSKRLSNIALLRHAAGEDFGWRTRDKFSCSYPESVCMRILEELQISYLREFRFGKYFIDFAFPDRKIAIEIDGKQHEKEERMKSDMKKDLLLIENGWTVHRIKWPDDHIRERITEIFKT